MSGWWAEQAWVGDRVLSGVRLQAGDGVFTLVRPDSEALPGDVVLPGLTLPGFANAHSHAFHRALRGRTHAVGGADGAPDAGRGSFWTWRDAMYALAGRLDPESYFGLARAAFAEMVAAGYTAVGEFHYLHHAAGGKRYDDPNAMGLALVAAARETGIRLTLLDTLYLHGGLDAAGHRPPDDTQLRFSDASVAAWADRVAALVSEIGDGGGLGTAGDGVRVGAAVHSIRAVSREELAEAAAAIRSLGLASVHAHVSEQPAENDACLAHYGLTPVALLADAGLLSPGFTAVHATHLTTGDITTLADAGASACFCPTTERDLADGIGPAGALRSAGVRLCLGSDQHAMIDPFAELQGLELNERLATGRRGHFTPAELVAVGTSHGHAALGWDGGDLREGAVADFVTVALDSPRTAGSLPDQAILAAGAGDVTRVVIGGRTSASTPSPERSAAQESLGRLIGRATAKAWEAR